jgi:hypothetical protein
MYGFAWLLRMVGLISRDFHMQLAGNDYAFTMRSQEDDTSRCFQFSGGNLRSSRKQMTTDFALIWRDNQSGGKVMMDMVLGKRKALYNAVIKGVLILEGEGRYVSLFMETMNHLNRMFNPKKKAKDSGKTV